MVMGEKQRPAGVEPGTHRGPQGDVQAGPRRDGGKGVQYQGRLSVGNSHLKLF